MPADSVAELCKACTSDARASETPANQQLTPIVDTLTQIPRVQDASTISRDDNDGILGMPTDVAAAHAFPTDEAGTKGSPKPTPVAPTVKPFPVVSRYQILDRLGEGGAGEVFLARQIATSRDVAIKVLNSPRTSDRQRFDREALHLGKLDHPAIVNVLEVGDSDRGPYICMELMPRGSLAQRLKDEGPLPEKEAARLMELIARGLAVVHDADILHRDLKPGNILLDKQGLPKIADFGLAKSTVSDAAHSLDGITQPGVMGTPAYMALEQAEARHEDVSKLTDVYGLGAILYHMLTGKPPHGGKTAWDIINKVLKERPRDPSALRPGLDPTLEAICLKCLEKQPENRYQSALEFADDLARWQHGDSTIARPASRSRKLVRWLGRQKRIAAVAVLVIAAAVTINLAGMWLKPKPVAEDSEKEVKKFLAELNSGEEVPLLTDSGDLRFPSANKFPLAREQSDFGDDTFCISATDEKIANLLDEKHVPESFEFKAEIRHEQAGANQNELPSTGIYIGFSSCNEPNGDKSDHILLLHFDNIYFLRQNILKTNLAKFGPVTKFYKSGSFTESHPRALSTKPISAPSPLQRNQWRLARISALPHKAAKFEITPEIESFNPPLITQKNIVDNIINFYGSVRPGRIPPVELVENPFQGSIGIYLRNGKVSIKNASIRKL